MNLSTLCRRTLLACGLVLCLVYPHRAILDDPVSAALGFTGMGAVLFGLILFGPTGKGTLPPWPAAISGVVTAWATHAA